MAFLWLCTITIQVFLPRETEPVKNSSATIEIADTFLHVKEKFQQPTEKQTLPS